MARARPSIEEARRALIVKPSSLGDVVHALPIPGLLKMANPDLRIAWVANPEWAPLVAGHPHVDEVIEFPRRAMRGLAAPARFWRWAKSALRAGGAPDLCLDLQCLFRSALIAKASGARWIGGLSDAREGAGLFYDASADVAGIAHAVDRYLAAPRQLLGIDFSAADVAFPLGEGEPVTPAPPDGFVLLHPFSRGGGKSLDPAAAAAYCGALAPRPVAVVGRFDAPCPLPGNAIDLLNQTSLAQLIWLARRAAFTISVDSGPLHIAAAAAAAHARAAYMVGSAEGRPVCQSRVGLEGRRVSAGRRAARRS
ncbi:MAG: glycosyltransferase family 9 protein [Verrucomicrobiales bacterium]